MSPRRSAAVLPALAVAVALACAPAAPAQTSGSGVTSDRARELAAAARDDPAAREDLEQVESIDGRRIDVGAILDGARPDEIAARVELALASAEATGMPGAGETPERDRRSAQEVLDDRRYTGTDVPRPFTEILRWVGRRLEPIYRFARDLVGAIPGGSFVGWTILAALIVLLAAAVSRFVIRRGGGRSGAGGRGARAGRPEDPAALERAADAAERDGDWEAAVRLRFRAGLLRLDSSELIAYRPSLTTGEVGRALRSEDFDRLGRDFDAIAYGGRPAAPEDAAQAREGWRAVLAGAPRG